MLYQSNLSELYETEYALFKSYNFSQEIFDTRSPAEIYLYIAIIKEHNKKMEEDHTTHQYVNPDSVAKSM